MNRLHYLSVIFWLCIFSCQDKSFEHLPIIELSRQHDAELGKLDSIRIEQGLFFRKLKENGFSDIYGFCRLIMPENVMEKHFEIILIACDKEDDPQLLVVTIHPRYQSIVDIMAFDPGQLQIASIGMSNIMPSFTDIKLVERNPDSPPGDTSLMQISPQGHIDEIALCCDF